MKRTVQKALTLLMLVVTIGGTLSTPVTVLADELTKVELNESNETEETIEQETAVTEETEQDETGSSVDFISPTDDFATLPDANAPPVQVDSAETERTVDELLARTDVFDVNGLTNSEIIKLAKALYGGWAKNDPTFGMAVTNDQGEAINIPFERSLLRAATAGDLTIAYTNYTYEGYRTSNPAWSIWGTVGKMHVNGKLAFCLDAETPALNGGGYYSSEVFPLSAEQLDRVTDITTLGINQSSYSDEEYAAAQLMIYDETSWAVTSTNLSDYAARKQAINNNISNFLITPSFDNQTIDLKIGESVTLTDTNNVLNQYVNTTKTIDGVEVTKNGNQLTLKATSSAKNGLDKLTMWKLTQIGAALCWYKEASQTLGTFEAADPVPFNLNVNIIGTGRFTLKKTSEFSNLGLIAGFKVEMSTGEIVELKTNESGIAECEVDFIAGTTGTITEVLTPSGYVTIDPVTFTIEAGKTIEVALINNLQKGKIKGYKQKTVLDAAATKEKGKPVYKKVPLAGAKFNLVAENDILLPDGKTISVKAGTIVDTVVTDENGYFESTKEFLIGEKNYYRLVETNVPEGYQAPSEDQILFSIPYGKATEKVIIYDLGTIDNELQKGKIKGYKQKTVLDAAATKEQGKPVYTKTPLAGAKFNLVAESDILMSDGKTVAVKAGTIVDTVITDEKGYFESSKELLIGEKNYYRLVETNVPEGYHEPSEKQTIFSIPNGKETENVIVYNVGSIDNELQKGTIKGYKQQTILDTVATKEQGKPVYEKVPLAGAVFDVVAETDILMPDGKTVAVKAGTIVDTVVTDKKGYFESTNELLIGEKNYYRLVETNVPEGYRAPSEDQVLFSIPYGKATEKVIVYDLGSIDNELQSGTLKFLKRDSLNFLGIDGAEFTVEMMSGLYAGTYFTFTTIALGNEFELPVGDYRLTEIKLPSGYKFDELTPQVQWVTIKDNETAELNWNNKKLVPRVGISTQAHTGDGKSQTFVWGEDVLFYDDSKLTHEDIPNGTKRGKNVKLHAVYEDGTTAVVWESGITEYTVTDKEMTERVIAEYDYKKDPKATPETRWYFSEDGYDEDGKKDTEHNTDGTDAKQDITPVLKETVTTKTTKTGSLPTTGEQVFVAFTYGGMIIAVIASYLFVMKNRKKA